MQVHESAENYLEAILMLQQEKGQVRSIDVAAELGFSKPSVSIAMKKLRESGYVEMGENGILTLTPAGHEIAARTYERHRLLSRYLISIGVPEKIAMEDACRIEHVLSPETFAALKEHLKEEHPDL